MKEKTYILLDSCNGAKVIQGNNLEQILIDNYSNNVIMTEKMFAQIINSNALSTIKEKIDFYNVIVDDDDNRIYSLYEISNAESIYHYC